MCFEVKVVSLHKIFNTMNKTFFIVVVAMFCAVLGCQRKEISQLDILEHFVDVNPDSVYSVLVELQGEAKGYGEHERMHYGLLRLKCQNILDLPFDSKDAINEIVDYYTDNGTYNEALLSRYLMGRSYVVAGNDPMAVECFNKCLSLKAATDEEIDYIQLSKVHSQLDLVYGNQHLIQFQLKELKLAEKCAYFGGDSSLALTYEYLKVHPFYKMGLLDSVICVTESVCKRFLNMGVKDKAAQARYMEFLAYIEKKEFDKAKINMEIFEKESGLFDSMGNVDNGNIMFYYLKGNLYEAFGQLDSAEYQYRRLLEYKEDINNVEGAYKGLLSLYRTLGNCDSIGKYADLYCEINDSVHARSVAEHISKMKAMYDYSEYKQQSEELQMQAEVMKRRTMLVAFIVLLVVVGMVFVIYNYRRKKQTEIDNLLEEYDRTLQTIEDLNDDKQEMLRRHQVELENIRNTLKRKGVPLSDKGHDDSVKAEVLERFREHGDSVGNGYMPITAEEWHSLLVEMTNNDSGFMLFLRKSNLSENEKRVAVLIRLQFKDFQIKRILDAYGSSLPNYKARINKKLFGEAGAKNLRRLITAYVG